ncbi:MAG: 3-ketoacyl-ACP reductase [Pseudonocardia sp. SCN 72-86]|nr:MAG: 3-ketoacyl-ACP reductase [Pseudonocardia sp. SCN 72-86]
MTGRVAGKVAFVTGAARGQGRAHAVRLAEEGADVVAIDVCADDPTVEYPLATEADLDETRELIEKAGQRAVTAVCDARDSAALRDAVDRGVAELGKIDIGVINHGILSWSPANEMSDEMWDAMIAVNLSGVFRAAREVVRPMIAAGNGGSVIMTSSNYGLKGAGGMVHYVAAKHGVVGLARGLAIDMIPHRIRVNTVNPTTVRTKMVDNEAVRGWLRQDLENPTSEDVAEPLRALHYYPEPWIDPSEVSHAVLYLASDESRYVTGISLPVDMGSLQK